MTIEVVYGDSRNRVLAAQVAAAVQTVVDEGTIYLGYPVLATADERVSVDALIVSRQHGLIALQVADGTPGNSADWQACIAAQDQLYSALDAHLRRYATLRRGRQLAVEMTTATVFPTSVTPPSAGDEGTHLIAISGLPTLIGGLPALDPEIF